MLKIKDDVDLKELEKFGFIKANSPYQFYSNKVFGVGEHKIITPLKEIDENCLNVVYDLIQAGLVEKVEK